MSKQTFDPVLAPAWKRRSFWLRISDLGRSILHKLRDATLQAAVASRRQGSKKLDPRESQIDGYEDQRAVGSTRRVIGGRAGLTRRAAPAVAISPKASASGPHASDSSRNEHSELER